MSGTWNICLTHDPALGGLYRAVNDFAQALDVPILSFDDGRTDRTGLAATDGARRVACGSGWLSRDCHRMPAAAAAEAERLLAGADRLVVHSLYRAHAPWAATWAGRHGRPYWAVPHACLDPRTLATRPLAKRAWLAIHGRRFLGGAERIVFATRRGLDKARAWIPGHRAVAVHWPVAMPSLHDRDAARSRFRLRLGLPADALLLLAVGHLHSIKRPAETVQAFCRAAPGRAHLAVVGMNGDVTRDTLERSLPKALAGRVHFTGGLHGERLSEAYLAADGFISLSWQENFGYAAADALAAGLPVILSPGHDIAHDLPRSSGGTSGPDGNLACGWLLPDDSEAAAVRAIGEWAGLAEGGASQARLQSLGAAGRTWAGEQLSAERFRERLAALEAG